MSVCSRGSCRLTYGRSAHMPAGPKRWRQMGSGFHDPYLSVARRRRRAGAPRTHNAARVMRGRDVRKSDTTVAPRRPRLARRATPRDPGRAWDGGMGADQVAATYEVSRTWVHRLVQRRRETGSIAPRRQTTFRRSVGRPHHRAPRCHAGGAARRAPDHRRAEHAVADAQALGLYR